MRSSIVIICSYKSLTLLINCFESFYFLLNYGGIADSSSAFLASEESWEQAGNPQNNQQSTNMF